MVICWVGGHGSVEFCDYSKLRTDNVWRESIEWELVYNTGNTMSQSLFWQIKLDFTDAELFTVATYTSLFNIISRVPTYRYISYSHDDEEFQNKLCTNICGKRRRLDAAKYVRSWQLLDKIILLTVSTFLLLIHKIWRHQRINRFR